MGGVIVDGPIWPESWRNPENHGTTIVAGCSADSLGSSKALLGTRRAWRARGVVGDAGPSGSRRADYRFSTLTVYGVPLAGTVRGSN
jgi:hypothetical protein